MRQLKVKRTREDEPSKARRGWQRRRGRPPETGDGSAAPAARKRSKRSVFGPSGEDRPDVLTDAETVVLPQWLHHRPSSGDGATAAEAAALLKSILVPAQPGKTHGPEPEPETGEPPAPEAEAEGEAAAGTAPESEADPEAAERQPADAGQDGTQPAGPVEAKAAEADPEAGVEADAKTEPGTETEAGGDAEPEPRAEAEAHAADAQDGGTKAGAEPHAPAAVDAATRPDAAQPDSETIVTINLADLLAAARKAEADQAQADQAIDTVKAIEAKTAHAMETIDEMTANALQAIDATAAESAAPDTGEAGQAESPRPEHADSAQPGRADTAGPSPGTDLAQTHVIRLDEPPASVTLTTPATETTIALTHPRAETTVAVAPSPANAGPATSLPQRAHPVEPAALPPAEPVPRAAPRTQPPYATTRRRTRVSRFLLLCLLAFQALMSLRLHNTAYMDEAQYLYSGHLELEHLLHGTPVPGNFTSLYSGSPVLYPVVAAALDQVGGLTAARLLSLAEMLSVTALLYSLSRRLFNERVALCAALLFCVTEPAIFLGNFATYDATSLFLLACAAWTMVRTAAFRWPVFLMAAPVAALAVAVKYAGLLFVPTIAVLPLLACWPLRGRRVLFYPLAFLAVVGGLLYAGLRLGGHAYVAAISSTTTNRAQGATPLTTLLRETAEWGGVIFVLALIGTAAYVWRDRTEPDESIAPTGSRFRRLCLGVVLTGSALLAPAYQAHLHTDVSFQKHVGFGLFFAAPIAGLGLARVLGDHFRRPHIAVAAWCVALVLGLVQANIIYLSWPNSSQFVQAMSRYLTPHGRYLVEESAVPIYYLLGHRDAQPGQFTSTFYIAYRDRKGALLTGSPGYTAAVEAGYFRLVCYYGDSTPAVDAALGRALASTKAYYLAAEINVNDTFSPGEYYVWVKGRPPRISGVFAHTSPKYQDLGTKTRELAP
jgi:hypothetical protein